MEWGLSRIVGAKDILADTFLPQLEPLGTRHQNLSGMTMNRYPVSVASRSLVSSDLSESWRGSESYPCASGLCPLDL